MRHLRNEYAETSTKKGKNVLPVIDILYFDNMGIDTSDCGTNSEDKRIGEHQQP